MSGFFSILLILAGMVIIHRLLRGSYHPYREMESRVMPLHPAYRHILKKNFKYYNLLSPGDQKIFERKLRSFIASKQFIPRQFPKITDEMKVLVSASAVQLTFGLPQVYLRHFRKIVIYLDTYYSQINKRYHKGEVNPAYGIIVLSWKNFVEGYADASDSLNVGIHEMAHALHLENVIINGEHSFLDRDLLKLWEELVNAEIEEYGRTGRTEFFREYAFTDEHEFFAVAVENFFEKPRLFKEQKPDLYFTLAALLNQDPLELYQK
ncbi:MAG: zinc-dependent peptidase [Candidatus Cyclobacteriaceae bacterium M2_1C_046]